jgi:hypothetical protein
MEDWTMTWPHVETNTQDRPQPLKYVTGSEVAKSLVVYASTVALDDDSRRLVPSGTLLCKITSGLGADKYGPYSGTATDGRQTIAAGALCFVRSGVDVTLGDRPIAGLYAFCVFDKSELTTGGYNLHSTPLTTIEAALPTCVFDD